MPPASDPPPRKRGASRRAWILVAIAAAILLAVVVAVVLVLSRGGDAPPAESTSADATSSESETSSPTSTPQTEPVLPLAVRVPADQAWTETAVRCDPGDTLVLSATGVAMHADEPIATVTPDGLTEPFFHQFNVPGLPDTNTASLIGSLDREETFFVGTGTSYACPRAGALFLGINDAGLAGNSGAWTATIDRVDAE